MSQPTALIAAMLVALTLTGCSGSDEPDSGAPGTTTKPTAPAITFDQAGNEGEVCLNLTGRERDVAALDTAMRANVDLVINEVTLEKSTGVTLVASDAINLPAVNTGGVIAHGAVVDWPVTKDAASSNVRWEARDALIGRSFMAGETSLPVLRIIGKDAGKTGTVVFHYTSADEPAGEARYDLDLRFSKRC